MTDRDRDALDGLPRIAPTRDDIESRRPSGRKGDPAPARRRGGTGAGAGTTFVLVVLIAGLTACGWFIVTQQQALEAARAERDQAEDRLRRIEERLSMTDQALDETESETQTQLQFWESEIRKLWDVSNKRNKQWIEENQAAIAQLTRTVEAQATAVDEVRAAATELRRAVGTREDQLAQLVTRQRTLTDRVNAVQQTVNALESGLARRVSANEEAVASVDAFRRDIVARVTRIQQQLDALAAGSGPARTLTPSP